VKKVLKIFVSLPVLSVLMFGVLNQSVCSSGGYYYRFTKVSIALVDLQRDTHYQTFTGPYPDHNTHTDTTFYFAVDTFHTANHAQMSGLWITLGIDFCEAHDGNVAYAAIEPGGGGSMLQLKSVQLFSLDSSTGVYVDMTDHASGIDSVFEYRWDHSLGKGIYFNSTRSSGALRGYADSFNDRWRFDAPLPFYTNEMVLFYRMSSESLTKLPGHYHLKLRMEFMDGLIIEPECQGVK
jgi:hypothetical protein